MGVDDGYCIVAGNLIHLHPRNHHWYHNMNGTKMNEDIILFLFRLYYSPCFIFYFLFVCFLINVLKMSILIQFKTIFCSSIDFVYYLSSIPNHRGTKNCLVFTIMVPKQILCRRIGVYEFAYFSSKQNTFNFQHHSIIIWENLFDQ